jgi:hypothetical protein
MKNIVWLIISCCCFTVGCGRKSDPTPESNDGYPHDYPKSFYDAKIQDLTQKNKMNNVPKH